MLNKKDLEFKDYFSNLGKNKREILFEFLKFNHNHGAYLGSFLILQYCNLSVGFYVVASRRSPIDHTLVSIPASTAGVTRSVL